MKWTFNCRSNHATALLAAVFGVGAHRVVGSTMVAAWGSNSFGTLGNGTTHSSNAPVVISGLSGVTTIAGGQNFSLAVQSGGAYAWGYNYDGEIGNGTTNTGSPGGVLTPVAVSGPPALSSGVTAIAGGDFQSLAARNGGLYTWGYNREGQLGNNSTVSSSVPVAISGFSSGVTAVGGGLLHSLAVRSGGAYAWGYNSSGQLGNNSTMNSSTPVAVTGLSNGVTAVAGGGGHSLALRNGGVYAWGYNGDGQLGNNSTNSSSVPVTVSGLSSGVTAIACGFDHSLAVQNGNVYAWGYNGDGELGDGTTTNQNSPEQIDPTDLTHIIAVAANCDGASSYALCSDGTIWDWGYNIDGELGLGTTTSIYLTPSTCCRPPVTFSPLSRRTKMVPLRS